MGILIFIVLPLLHHHCSTTNYSKNVYYKRFNRDSDGTVQDNYRFIVSTR